MLDLMPHVGVKTLSIYKLMPPRQMVMTSCHSNVKEYAGAMLVQVMQIRAEFWCGSSICNQLSLVHMIGRGSRQR